MSETENYATLSIYLAEGVSSESISEGLGIEPTRVTSAAIKNAWHFSTQDLVSADAPEEHLRYILQVFQMKQVQLHDLAEAGNEIRLWMKIDLAASNFSFVVDQELVILLQHAAADICIDIWGGARDACSSA